MTTQPPNTPTPIRLTKVADLGTIPDHPIFNGYTVEGLTSEPRPAVGLRFAFLRTNRNGVEILGVFSTSPVTHIESATDKRVTFKTANSSYVLDLDIDTSTEPR
jgi:hypothetical protein